MVDAYSYGGGDVGVQPTTSNPVYEKPHADRHDVYACVCNDGTSKDGRPGTCTLWHRETLGLKSLRPPVIGSTTSRSITWSFDGRTTFTLSRRLAQRVDQTIVDDEQALQAGQVHARI